MPSIKIGPYDYDLSRSAQEGMDGFDKDMWGDCRHDLQRIRVNKHAHPQVNLVTLMHEVLHGINFVNASKIPEEVVAELAPMLIMVLEENDIDMSPWHKRIEAASEDGEA
jgi:hypothetical protein